MTASSSGKSKRVLVLLKRSSYKKYVEEQHDARVEELLAHGDPAVARMRKSHEANEETIAEVRDALADLGADAVYDEDVRAEHAGKFAMVVTVGGDGTLLAASHRVDAETAILGVNSAPEHSVGFFCAARKGSVRETFAAAFDGRLRRVSLARMRVDMNDKCVHKRVLNEALFCHASPAATSRYILRVLGPDGASEEEEHKSSGIWIGPAAGSTAAQRSAGGRVLPLSSTRLQYVVREPYTPLGTRKRLVLGLVEDGGALVLKNKMKNAKLFLDGEHTVYDATIGDVITLRRSDEFLTVLGLTRTGDRPPTSKRGST